LIYNNYAYVGGGVVLFQGILSNNTIVANDVRLGGESGVAGNLYILFQPPQIQPLIFNNIICDAPSGGGIYWESSDPASVITFNDVWNNQPGNYAAYDSTTGGIIYDGQVNMTGLRGNISKDPLFVNPLRYDFHLKQGSPCINTGDPNYVPAKGQIDIDGGERIHWRRIDIGADEYTGYMPPLAYAGPDQHVLEPLIPVTLDGTGSSFFDPCGVVSFQWAQVAGPNVVLIDTKAAKPTFTPPSYGEYRFSLVVADAQNVSGPDEVMVLVSGNHLPVANAGSDKAWKVPGQVTLDGTGSYDPDPPDILTYRWKQLKGPQVFLENADSATPYFQCDIKTIFLFELVVSDGFGESLPSTVQIGTVGVLANQQSFNISVSATLGYCHYLDVSGNKLVCSVGTGDDYSWGIVCIDLKTGQIDSSFGTSGIDTQARIDGDLVVWAGGPVSTGVRGPENLSVFVRDITTGTQRTLRSYSATESYSHPAVSGHKVVWLQHRNINKANVSLWRKMPYDICGADVGNLSSPPVYFTIASEVGRRDPYAYQNYAADYDHVIDISGNIVVWEAGWDIYGADISNLSDIKVFTISNHPARQYDPAISGNIVVWTDTRNDSGDIYGADISQLTDIRELEVVKARGTQLQPAIDGRLVVFIEGTDNQGLIKASCLTRKYGPLNVEIPSFVYGVYGIGPAIDGGAILWLTNVSTGIPQGLLAIFGYSPDDGLIKNVTSRKCYDYIQHAIDCAYVGDHVVAPQGIYNEKINFKGKNLTVSSADPNDPDVVAGTVITGNGQLVTFAGTEDATCVLSGFTITNGNPDIWSRGAKARVVDCVVKGSISSGIRLSEQSELNITGCTIYGNERAGIEMLGTGVGRVIKYCYPIITNSIIAGNRQYGIVGGVPTVNNSTVVNNVFEGISGPRMAAMNSIIYYNGIKKSGVQIVSPFSDVAYSDIQGGWVGLGNFDKDPCFVDIGCWVQAGRPEILLDPGDPNAVWAMGDYHLLSEAWSWDMQQRLWIWDDVTSPCIDAGNPGCSLGQELLFIPDDPMNKWGRNVRIDMGAYGGTAEASIAPHGWEPLADINNDGIVDLRDFALQARGDFGLLTPNPADLTRDKTVNLSDLAELAQCWLQ
jgi:beta propeller repeat protein/parallel beta-helix repeat protein